MLRTVHNRMPVMLRDHDAMTWLAFGGGEPAPALSLLRPFPAELMEGYEVSMLVNNPRNDLPACIEPAAPESPGLLFAGSKSLT